MRLGRWTFGVLAVWLVPGVCAADRAAARRGDSPERAWGASLDLDAGARMLRLSTLQVGTQPVRVTFVPRTAWGPTFGASAAARFLLFTVGGSTSLGLFPDESDGRDASVWHADLDLGVRLPFRRVEPHLSVGVGYTRVDGLDDGSRFLDGMNGHVVLGVNAIVTRHLVIGGRIEGHLVALTRDDVSFADAVGAGGVATDADADRELRQAEGTSLGGTLGLLLDVGFRL